MEGFGEEFALGESLDVLTRTGHRTGQVKKRYAFLLQFFYLHFFPLNSFPSFRSVTTIPILSWPGANPSLDSYSSKVDGVGIGLWELGIWCMRMAITTEQVCALIR